MKIVFCYFFFIDVNFFLCIKLINHLFYYDQKCINYDYSNLSTKNEPTLIIKIQIQKIHDYFPCNINYETPTPSIKFYLGCINYFLPSSSIINAIHKR